MCFRDMPWHEGHYATDRLHRSRTGFCPDYRVCFPESLQVAGFLTLPPARAESSSINRKPRCAKESRMRATIIAGENLWTFVKRERTSSRSQGSFAPFRSSNDFPSGNALARPARVLSYREEATLFSASHVLRTLRFYRGNNSGAVKLFRALTEAPCSIDEAVARSKARAYQRKRRSFTYCKHSTARRGNDILFQVFPRPILSPYLPRFLRARSNFSGERLTSGALF